METGACQTYYCNMSVDNNAKHNDRRESTPDGSRDNYKGGLDELRQPRSLRELLVGVAIKERGAYGDALFAPVAARICRHGKGS